MRDSRRGGILSALLLTGLAVVCLVVFAGVYFAHNVSIETKERNGGSDVSIDTPAGHLTVRTHDTPGGGVSDIPIYPGARVDKDSGGGAVVQWTSSSGRDGGVAVSASEMVTKDSLDKVVKYYRTQMPNWVMARDSDGEVQLELREGGYKRVVAIHAKHDGTHIGVASTGEPASN
jgi:hypothetical protein